jgi:hypothetical protein
MEIKEPIKLVSLFLVSSVCLLGYTAMSAWGTPTPTAGMVAIDDSTLIYQGNNVNYTFASDSVVPRLEVGLGYIEIGTVRIAATVSTGYVNSSLLQWSNSHSIEWTTNATNPTANVNYSVSGLLPFYKYDMLTDSAIIDSFTTTSTGIYSFNYSGPWSTHTFEIRYFAPTIAQQMGLGYATLMFDLLVIGVVVGIVGEAIYPLKHEKITFVKLTQRLIYMMVYIVIAMALLGVVYMVIFT